MRLFESRPALRWLVPVAVLGVVAGTSLIASTATADPALPPRTAEQLLVDVQDAQLSDLSGTVVQTSDLGLPELPGLGSGGEGLTALLSGTHTLRVWLAGEDKARLAVLSTLGEYDVVRNGSDVWTWQSSDNSATHRTLPAGSSSENGGHPTPQGTPQTPKEIADQILGAIQPTTEVATDRTVSVAGRDAYELVLTPKTNGSLLTEVTIAVDAVTHSPLQVKVYAGQTVVFEVGYTAVDFNRPEDRQFDFVAPPGAKVTEVSATDANPTPSPSNADEKKPADKPTVIGTGWSTVVIATMKADSTSVENQGNPGGGADLQRMLAALPTVHGDWGTGRLLTGKAFSVVITDDGRVAAGAVAPSVLYAALEK